MVSIYIAKSNLHSHINIQYIIILTKPGIQHVFYITFLHLSNQILNLDHEAYIYSKQIPHVPEQKKLTSIKNISLA